MLSLDGRGERATHLSGRAKDGELEVLATTELPHSLGLLYEELTGHLGFRRRSTDEYKVMALAAYGEPVHLQEFRECIRVLEDGTFVVEPVNNLGTVSAAARPPSLARHRRLHFLPNATKARLRPFLVGTEVVPGLATEGRRAGGWCLGW